MRDRLKLNINREKRWVLRQTRELRRLLREFKSINSTLEEIESNDKDQVKQTLLKKLVEKEKREIKSEEIKISRFERRVHLFRLRIDSGLNKLTQKVIILDNKKFIRKLKDIKSKIDVNEGLFLKLVSYPTGDIAKELNQKKIVWGKVKRLTINAENSLNGLLLSVRELNQIRRKIFKFEKKTHVQHSEYIQKRYAPASGVFRHKFFFDAKLMYASLVADITNAQDSIYLESYMFFPDSVGDYIASKLIEKAIEFNLINKKTNKNNKNIILLFDGIGSSGDKRMNLKFITLVEKMRGVGIDVHIFNQPRKVLTEYEAFSVIRHPFVALFGRNHRKLAVIDRKIGFIGGMNISEDYYTIRDTHMRITGKPVQELIESFEQSITLCQKYEFHALSVLNKKRREIKKEYNEMVRLAKEDDIENETDNFRVINNRPSVFHHGIRDEYISLIESAKKEINITTPYFIPGWKFVRVLARAAKRGVLVRLLLSEKSDFPLMDKGAKKYYPLLLKSGVEIYHYSKKGIEFVHAKTMTVDYEFATVGSSNLDYVSLTLNCELNIFFRDQSVTKDLDVQFQKDLQYCTKYTLEMLKEEKKNQTILEKFALFFGHRILGPLLQPIKPGYD